MASGDQNSDLRRTPRVLGSLESRIMEQLWATNAPCSVQDVVDALGGGHNYKTVMTVLNRLVTKQLLTRELDGRAYRYRAPNSRTDFMRSVADEIVRSYEGAYGSEGMPHLVRAIGASAPSPRVGRRWRPPSPAIGTTSGSRTRSTFSTRSPTTSRRKRGASS